jgi:hypothetical protein
MNKLVKTKKVTPVALKIFMLVVGPSVTDPYVFGPPEFAFLYVCNLFAEDPSINKQKIKK